jgi:hypothetical protein
VNPKQTISVDTIPADAILASIHSSQLVTATGGAGVGSNVLRKAGPVANVLSSAYDGYSGYQDSRARGKGVGESVANGAKEIVKGVTLYDLWKPTPAY